MVPGTLYEWVSAMFVVDRMPREVAGIEFRVVEMLVGVGYTFLRTANMLLRLT